MDIPIYVTVEEVGRVCQELGLRNWSQLDHPDITSAEAEIVRENVGGEAANIPVTAFQNGLQVELEHGTEGQHHKQSSYPYGQDCSGTSEGIVGIL